MQMNALTLALKRNGKFLGIGLGIEKKAKGCRPKGLRARLRAKIIENEIKRLAVKHFANNGMPKPLNMSAEYKKGNRLERRWF